MVDVSGKKLKKGDPVYYMYYKGRKMILGVISHFTNQGITVLNRHWKHNIRGISLNSRIIKLTDDMITPYMQTEIDNIKEEYKIT